MPARARTRFGVKAARRRPGRGRLSDVAERPWQRKRVNAYAGANASKIGIRPIVISFPSQWTGACTPGSSRHLRGERLQMVKPSRLIDAGLQELQGAYGIRTALQIGMF